MPANDSKKLSFKYAKETLKHHANQCKTLEYMKPSLKFVTGTASDVLNLPVIAKVAGNASLAASVIGHSVDYMMDMVSTSLGCDEVPFEELKLLMREKFYEINRKLDKQIEVLGKIHKLTKEIFNSIEKIRMELKQGFKNILEAIEFQDVKGILFRIRNFNEYFEMERRAIRGLKKSEYIGKLEEEDGLLKHLKYSNTPKGDSLSSALKELIHPKNNYAIPENENDEKAFQALYALFYGTQTYASVMFFLIEQHSYLANYYYQERDTTSFNEQFEKIVNIFRSFKLFLIEGTGSHISLIDKVIKIFENNILGEKIIQNEDSKLYHNINNYTNILKNLRSDVSQIKLPLIEDEPNPPTQIGFKNASLQPPLVNWIQGISVTYAVQYERNGIYSKLSKWTDPIMILNQTNPIIKVSINQNDKINRLLFRKIGDMIPQFIGKLSPRQRNFWDLDRDLYDAAGGVNKDVSFTEFMKLVEISASINATFEMDRTAIHAAAKSGNSRIAKKLLSKGVNIDTEDKLGYTPLHIAAEAGQSNFVNFLITRGANVNAKTAVDNLSPLHIAVRNGFLSTISELLKSPDIDVNQGENEDLKPLHLAVSSDYNTVQTLLNDSRVNVTARMNTGITPLHLAVIKENLGIVVSLIKLQEDLNVADNKGMTAVHYAVMNSRKKILRYLLSLKNRINVNAVTLEKKWSPLHLSLYFNKEDVSFLLIKSGNINLNLISEEGASPLHVAVGRGQINVVRKLLEKGAKVNLQTKEDYLPLHFAIMRDDIEIFMLLVEKNSDIHLKLGDGKSALHLAASRGAINVSKKLLDMGFSLTDYDNREYTPYHYAALNDEVEMMKLFINHDSTIMIQKTKDFKELSRIIRIIIYEKIYNNLLKDYKEPFDFDYFLEKMGRKGIYDMLLLMYNESREVQTESREDQKRFLTTIIYLNFKKCYERSDKSLRALFSSSTNIIDTEEFRSCVLHYTLYHRRSLQSIKGDYMSPEFEKNIENYGDFKNFYLSGFQKYSLLSSKPLKIANKLNLEDITLRKGDFNGMILLLDVLLRKFTKEKYMKKKEGTLFELEAQARALTIAENFEDLLNTVSTVPANEKIDMTEVHSRVYKAIRSGKEKEIMLTLCSYVKAFFELQPEKLHELVDTYMTKVHLVFHPGFESYQQLSHLLQDSCLSE